MAGDCSCGLRCLGSKLSDACSGFFTGSSGSNKFSMESSVAKIVAKQIGKPMMRRASKIHKSLLLLGTDTSRTVNESYKVLRQLGAGGFGSVFLAESRATGETVAIKHIKKLDHQQDMSCVHRELESLLWLDHPNIAKFHRFFEDEKAVYVVQEFCSDGDFCELTGEDIEDPEVRSLFRDIVVAVSYCHQRGVVHRDIKFENCLIHALPSGRRVGKIIDFGLAAIRREGDTDRWLNDTLGSRYFVAPEVLDTSIPYGEKIDCWALGVMLYILATDEHPFAEQACNLPDKQFYQMVRTRGVRQQPMEEAEVSEDARDLIAKFLARDPQERLDAHSALFHAWLDPQPQQQKQRQRPSAPSRISRASSTGSGSSARRLSLPVFGRSRTYTAAGPAKLEEQILERIKTFGSFTRFERAVLTLVAHYAQEREVADMQAVFFKLDTSRSGSLSKQELRQGLEKCGHGISDEEFEELFRSLDGDGTGEVAYTEWLAATMEAHVLASKSAIQQLYNLFSEGGLVQTQRLRSVLGHDRSFSGILGPGGDGKDTTLNEDQFKSLIWDIAEAVEPGSTPKSHASSSPGLSPVSDL